MSSALRSFKVRLKEVVLLALKKRNKNIIITKALSLYIHDLCERKIDIDIIKRYEMNSTALNANHQTPLNQIQFLGFLIQISQAKKILEIGTYKGLTSLYLASIVPDGAIFSCENDSLLISEIEDLWNNYPEKNLTLLRGDAAESMRSLKKGGQRFDFIYIDADKKQYLLYLELAKAISKPGTIIAIDNVLWAGLVAEKDTRYSHAKIMDHVNQTVFNDTKNPSCIISAWDGLLLLQII